MMITGLHVLIYDNSEKLELNDTFTISEYTEYSISYPFSTFDIDKMLYFNISTRTNFTFVIQKYDSEEIFPNFELLEDNNSKINGYIILGIDGDLEKNLGNDIIEKYSNPTNSTNIKMNITLSNDIKGWMIAYHTGELEQVYYRNLILIYTDRFSFYAY